MIIFLFENYDEAKIQIFVNNGTFNKKKSIFVSRTTSIKSTIMKKCKLSFLCFLLSGSILFSSCIGSFQLFNNLREWNQGIGDKFVNELVFLAFNIIPIYGVAYIADVLVLNSIEFWTGNNPVAQAGDVKEVRGEDGIMYTVTTTENGYSIAKEGEEATLDLVYNAENNSWNAVSGNESFELVSFNEDGTATMNLQNGEKMTIVPNAQGVAAARVATTGTAF